MVTITNLVEVGCHLEALGVDCGNVTMGLLNMGDGSKMVGALHVWVSKHRGECRLNPSWALLFGSIQVFFPVVDASSSVAMWYYLTNNIVPCT